MNFDFSEVLTRSWKIIWKHKILWVFGILASCARGGNGGGGNGGGGNSGFNNGSNPDQFSYQFERVSQWFENNMLIVVAIVIFIILLSIIFAILGFIGKIALIKGAYKADKGAESLAFGELFSESLPYFWRVFGLSFLIGLVTFVIIIPFVVIGIVTAGVGFLCLLPLLCILVPVGIVLTVVLEQANTAIVLEDLGMLDGFKRGWEVTKSNAGAVAIIALILMFGGGIVGFIFAIPFIIAVFPIIFGAASEAGAVLWIGIACIIAYLPILIVLNGILTAYIQSVWTLTFMRLTVQKTDAPVFIEANA